MSMASGRARGVLYSVGGVTESPRGVSGDVGRRGVLEPMPSYRARSCAGGRYVTLRLKASMYHRFHAPHDCRVEAVRYVPGETWNVNPPALERVPRLFARNERAVLRARLDAAGCVVTMVPVAAVLVASIRLHFLDLLLHARYRGPRLLECDVALRKGQEMGWFQHGSTMIVLAPDGLELTANVRPGAVIRMGQPLLRLP